LDKLAKWVSNPIEQDRLLILRDDSDLVEAVMDPKLALRTTRCLGTSRWSDSTWL
jgi:hypothetical protein